MRCKLRDIRYVHLILALDAWFKHAVMVEQTKDSLFLHQFNPRREVESNAAPWVLQGERQTFLVESDTHVCSKFCHLRVTISRGFVST